MSLAETEATIAALRPEHWRDLAEVIVLTGLRIGEALALRWEDVDPAACRIRVAHSAEQRGRTDGPTKTPKSTRSLRVEPAVIDLILAQPRTQERVFPRRYAAALSAIRRAMKRAGTYRRDRGWHSLRHTNTALRNEAGQSIRDAAAALGHGAHFAQSMAYGWHAENREAPALSDLRQREAPSGRKPRRPT
jgi:integrase